MKELTFILTCFTLASIFGTIAAMFYGVRQKTIIETLEASNKAYAERNKQLEALTKEQAIKITALEGRVTSLENIKTPALEPLIAIVNGNHKQVMAILESL